MGKTVVKVTAKCIWLTSKPTNRTSVKTTPYVTMHLNILTTLVSVNRVFTASHVKNPFVKVKDAMVTVFVLLRLPLKTLELLPVPVTQVGQALLATSQRVASTTVVASTTESATWTPETRKATDVIALLLTKANFADFTTAALVGTLNA